MALKFFGKQAKREEKEVSPHTFLFLMFVNRSIQAALWKVEEEEVTTLSQSSLLSFEDDEDGLIKIDQALQELGSESENVNQVVFAFDPHWVDEDGLNKEKKKFIKSVTKNLGLKPVGFVVITDALVQQILSEDSMASEVLVYIQEDTVAIFLLKQGKLIDQLSVGRSEDIVQDIVEGLARFSKQLTGNDTHLPAKLMLASPVLSASEIDDAQQQIMNYNWSDNHPFVQAPIVESMLALDVLYAVVKQGGIAVAQSRGLKTKRGNGKIIGAEEFGFESVDSPVDKGDNFSSLKGSNQVTSFGVPIGDEALPDEPVAEKKKYKKSNHRMPSKLKLPKFMKKLQRWYKNHPHKNIIRGGMISGLLAWILLSVGWVVFAYQVSISVQLTEKVITKDLEIIIDPTISESNFKKQILKASLETLEVVGKRSTDTTGVTLVGDKASGTVTIFNKTTSPKTFSAGTSVSTGSVAFTLNDEVTVASSSSEESGGQLVTNYGTEEVAVTANDIGAEGNIGGGTELTVDSFDTSTYAATAKETFSGGSSREVRVISEDDLDNLLIELTESLLADATQQFSNKSGDGVYYALMNDNKVIEENYDGEVGDESDQLSLSLTLEVSAAKYNSEDIRPLLEEALKDDIPEGYQLVEEDPELLSSPRDDATASSDTVLLDASVRAKARPPFDEQNIIDSILGLSLGELIDKLIERPEIDQASYTLKPGLAKYFVSKVPKSADRIMLEISN